MLKWCMCMIDFAYIDYVVAKTVVFVGTIDYQNHVEEGEEEA